MVELLLEGLLACGVEVIFAKVHQDNAIARVVAVDNVQR